ncbi:hypothetical protein FN846DRAFT_909222 [Sphaerosporella brunnea]|uniref:Uncharacterized protein n=1 Tax=Sphaerosporella brunnea TaxID=1250544 RepID=A0A5J5ERB8_9PEZI|nr:hypothetical protein FN846DRAFT_909222 [Sphaerosporella brunnea]
MRRWERMLSPSACCSSGSASAASSSSAAAAAAPAPIAIAIAIAIANANAAAVAAVAVDHGHMRDLAGRCAATLQPVPHIQRPLQALHLQQSFPGRTPERRTRRTKQHHW